MQQSSVAISIERLEFSASSVLASPVQVDCVLFAGYRGYPLSSPSDHNASWKRISMHFGGKRAARLPVLRFHVGSDAARQLLDSTQNLRSMLNENYVRRLINNPTSWGPSLSGTHVCLAGPVLSIESDVLPEG